MKFARVLIGLVILCSVARAAPRSPVYLNKEFGILLPIPKGAWLCPAQGNGIDHGPSLLLGSRDARVCRSSSEKRWISIFAGGNAVDESKTLHTFLNWECEYPSRYGNEPNTVCGKAPAGLSVNELPSEAARIDHPDGSIEIFVVAQAGKPDPDFDATVPSVNYVLSLNTNADHLDEDLVVFRAILSHVKLNPLSH